jgi:cytochrome oxidase Cu insertion factor (SCO1/SenC/PrrC family)
VRLAVAAAITGCVLLASAGCSSASNHATSSTPSAYSGTTVDRELPSSITHVPLTDQAGRVFTLGSLKGKTVVLADFLTSCQEVCPLTSAAMQQVVRSVDRAGLGGQVVVLEATVDPQRDTPSRLLAYQALFGAQRGWTFATGTPAHMARLWRGLGVAYHRTPEPSGAAAAKDWQTGRPLRYDVDHQDVVYVIDASGHERWLAIGTPGGLTSPDLPTPMRAFLNDEGAHNLAAPAAQAWTAADVTNALSVVLGVPIKTSLAAANPSS